LTHRRAWVGSGSEARCCPLTTPCALNLPEHTGLKYLESLIALELRQKLTKHAHQQYLKNNNFYKCVLSPSSRGVGRFDARFSYRRQREHRQSANFQILPSVPP